MGKLLRAEPEGSKFLDGYPQTRNALQKAKWLKFIQKFKGYHKEVTKAFARSFDGKTNTVEIGDLQFTVTESSLAQATALPRTGERWFKNRTVESQEWKNILKNPGMDTTIFTKGIPVSNIKKEWTALLLLVQKFLTCEGRFGTMYVYHTKIMMHFMGEHTINLPYFLLSSLKKMSATVQKHVGNIEPHLYHHGLIKILIEEQLKIRKDTWEKFLIRNHFQEAAETSVSSPKVPASISSPKVPRRSRRKEKETAAQDTDVEETAAQDTDVEETVQEIIAETLQEIAQETVLETGQKEREKGSKTKRQKRDKGKAILQTPSPSPEPSTEEDTQTLAHRLAQLQETAISKKKSTSIQVRRSRRLIERKSVIKGKQSHFVDLSTPEKRQIQLDIDSSPPREESPFQQERESSFQEFEFRPRQTPDIDPVQQEAYDYLETLEQSVAGPSTVLPLEQQVQSLKQEIFELEVLNRHIKNENEKLKEKGNLDKMIHDNTMLHLGLWQRKNRKLKRKCKKLSRALINLKFRCLVKKPRTSLATKRKRRRLDVLAEASEHMN